MGPSLSRHSRFNSSLESDQAIDSFAEQRDAFAVFGQPSAPVPLHPHSIPTSPVVVR